MDLRMDLRVRDEHEAGGYLSLHGAAIGSALRHEEWPRPTTSGASGQPRRLTDEQVGRARNVGGLDGLSANEERLLRVFVARRGQCVPRHTLEREYAAARRMDACLSGDESTSEPAADLSAAITALAAKLRESALRTRLIAVEGCGYLLWH